MIHEAPAPIGQEAQPAADRRARKAAKAIAIGARAQVLRPNFVGELVGVPRALGVCLSCAAPWPHCDLLPVEIAV